MAKKQFKSIKGRLFRAFLAVLLFTLGVNFLGWINIIDLRHSLQKIGKENWPIANASMELRLAFLDKLQGINSYLDNNDIEAMGLLLKADKSISDQLEILLASNIIDKNKIDTISELINNFQVIQKKLFGTHARVAALERQKTQEWRKIDRAHFSIHERYKRGKIPLLLDELVDSIRDILSKSINTDSEVGFEQAFTEQLNLTDQQIRSHKDFPLIHEAYDPYWKCTLDLAANYKDLIAVRTEKTKLLIQIANLQKRVEKKLKRMEVIARTNMEEFTNTSIEEALNALIMFAVLGLFAMIVSFTIASQTWKRIINPISILTMAIRKISKDGFHESVIINSQDEFEILAEHFNNMTKKLHEQNATLKSFSENLQTMVSERTSELVNSHSNLLQEITRHKRSKEEKSRLADLLEATSDFVGIADSKGQVVYVNPAGKKMLGIAKKEDLLKTSIPDYFSEGVNEIIQREVLPTAAREGIWSGEVAFLHRKGHEIPVSMVTLAHKSSNGTLQYFSTISRDLTERIQAEHKLIHSSKLASIGQLAGGVAHELRNCLGGMMNYVQIIEMTLNNRINAAQQILIHLHNLSSYLKKEEFSKISAMENKFKSALKQLGKYEEKIIGYVAGIKEMGNRGTKITNDLLTFSKKNPPQLKPTEINKIIKTTLGIVKKEFSKSNIQVLMELDPDLPSIKIDPDQINQVIMNLVLNAKKAINGKGEIKLSTGLDPSKKNLEIYVSDTGCGMKDEILNKIFDPFFTTFEVGTGLGLSVSYGIIHNHKGEISAESRVGKGTTFKIQLPLK